MKKAFTLVELLVVIGILGILMGVLLGTFSGAGESARAAKCMANLRNLGMAVQSYAMNNGGSYPSTISPDADDGKSEKKGWISYSSKGKGGSFISPYAGSQEEREFSLTNGLLWAAINRERGCYFCPTHQRYVHDHNLGQDPLWSYMMNPNVSGSYGNLERADCLLLFAELPFAKMKNGDFEQAGQISGDELDPTLKFKNPDGSGGTETIGFNHRNGKTLCAHVCYADGHVAKLLAPKTGDAIDLTSWLCKPTDKEDGDFTITFDGTRYQKSTATE